VSKAIPLRINALHLLDQMWQAIDQFENELHEELMIAWTTPAQRSAITAAIYASQKAYVEGGITFRKGLFPWEERLLASPLFPRGGHLLIGAVGGGREIAALVARGYQISGFEPSDLFDHAQEIARREGRVTVARGAYSDLIDAAAGRPSPLSGLVRGSAFDAVILGWGSLSHILDRREREALLEALRSVAPGAPVVLSYLPFHQVRRTGRIARGRLGLRRTLTRSGAEHQDEEALHFSPWAGFSVGFTEDDLRQLAAAGGYRVALLDVKEYPNAVLVPLE